jgi:hypothetical protein
LLALYTVYWCGLFFKRGMIWGLMPKFRASLSGYIV